MATGAYVRLGENRMTAELPAGLKIDGRVARIEQCSHRYAACDRYGQWSITTGGSWSWYFAKDGQWHDDAQFSDDRFWFPTREDAVSFACLHADLPEGWKIAKPNHVVSGWHVVKFEPDDAADDDEHLYWNGLEFVDLAYAAIYPNATAAYLAIQAAASPAQPQGAEACPKPYQSEGERLCRDAYNALLAIFGDMAHDDAMKVAVRENSTFATRAFMAWAMLKQAFGSGKYDPNGRAPLILSQPTTTAELPAEQQTKAAIIEAFSWRGAGAEDYPQPAMTTEAKPAELPSQVSCIGLPPPRTWDDYEAGCLATFSGGHENHDALAAFQHGMRTVFNLLRSEFPPAETIRTPVQATAEREVDYHQRWQVATARAQAAEAERDEANRVRDNAHKYSAESCQRIIDLQARVAKLEEALLTLSPDLLEDEPFKSALAKQEPTT